MAEFADNNTTSSAIKLTPFFANKGYYPRISFSSDTTAYGSTRARLQAAKAEDITGTMSRILDYIKSAAETASQRITTQANRKRKDVIYKLGDKVFLSSKNIKTTRLYRKLDDKILGPFPITKQVGNTYRLQLPKTIKVHRVFHPNLLRKAAQDPLHSQKATPLGPIIVEKTDQYEVDDILNARLKGGRLQYRVKQTGYKDRDLTQYNTNSSEFDSAINVISNFYKRYPYKAGAAIFNKCIGDI